MYLFKNLSDSNRNFYKKYLENKLKKKNSLFLKNLFLVFKNKLIFTLGNIYLTEMVCDYHSLSLS